MAGLLIIAMLWLVLKVIDRGIETSVRIPPKTAIEMRRLPLASLW
jgi:hypothetical protein